MKIFIYFTQLLSVRVRILVQLLQRRPNHDGWRQDRRFYLQLKFHLISAARRSCTPQGHPGTKAPSILLFCYYLEFCSCPHGQNQFTHCCIQTLTSGKEEEEWRANRFLLGTWSESGIHPFCSHARPELASVATPCQGKWGNVIVRNSTAINI